MPCTCANPASIPPCPWCESLSPLEASILDTHGYSFLLWLQSHAFISSGKLDPSPGETDEEFLSLCRDLYNSTYLPNVAAKALDLLCDQIRATPPLPVSISPNGVTIPVSALRSAKVIPFPSSRSSPRRLPISSSILPFKRTP